MKNKKSKKKTWFLLTAVCLILVFGTRAAMAALENSNSTGVRSVHVSDSEIPVSTMVVGSMKFTRRPRNQPMSSIRARFTTNQSWREDSGLPLRTHPPSRISHPVEHRSAKV